MGRKLPPLTHTVNNDSKWERKWQMRREKEKKSKKERKERKKETKKGKRFVERKGKKRRKEEREREDFSVFWRLKFDSSKIKLGPCSLIYVWTPKSGSFGKLHKVGYFPTLFTFSLKAIKW